MSKNDDNLFGLSDDRLGLGDLGGRYSKNWVEENFTSEGISSSTGSQSTPAGFHLGVSISNKKILFFIICFVLGFVIIFSRLFYLQILKGSDYRNLAEGNRVRLRSIPSERGIIYDNQGRQLVQNVPSFYLAIVPRDLPIDSYAKEMVLRRVAIMVGVPYEQIADYLKQYGSFGYESLIIKENLDHRTALSLYIQNADLPGVVIDSGTKRLYLSSPLPSASSTLANLAGLVSSTPSTTPLTAFSLSHLLGYTGKLNIDELKSLGPLGYLPSDEAGKSGLEKEYEQNLRGTYGRKKIEVDAVGREQNILAEDPPAPGKNLYLTIDSEAQAVMENIVKKNLIAMNFKRASAIAINPKTGGILAMVSWPAFNNNDFSGGISNSNYQAYLKDVDRPLFNRSIAGVYPSGSTIKPVIVAAALEEKVITRYTTVNSTGGITVGKWTFKDWKAGGHGITNATKAIAWSVNTFFYYVGGGYGNFVGLGAEKLVKYLRLFNLGMATGVDLPGERSGFVPSPEWKLESEKSQWYVGDTYNLSIGQGELLVTPLQVAVWTSTVANGGKIIWPHLADHFRDEVKNVDISLSFPIKKQNFISADSLLVAREGMRECVKTGSCKLLQTLNFSTGGKTGTAQWNNNKSPHAWFTSFAPYEDPTIAVTVLVEEGKEGSTAAMPIARDFLRWWGTKYLYK